MPIRLDQLASSLERALSPVYLIAGDEILLVEEACDAVLAAARSQGYSERTLLLVEASFDWRQVAMTAASPSLFAARRIIDLRVPANRFDRKASEALRAYAKAPQSDVLLLIRSGQLDRRQRNSAWYKALDQAGVVAPVWKVGPGELPRWLKGRLQANGLRLSAEALAYLCDRVQGNLLAADQEVRKLALLDLASPVGLEAVAAAVEDTARFGVFEVIDALFAGDAIRLRRVLHGLRQEGVAIMAVLGVLVGQLRRLDSGQWMPDERRRQLPAFKRRIGSVESALAQLALIDQQVKGLAWGDPWLALERTLLRYCGQRLTPMGRDWRYLRRTDLLEPAS